MFKFWIYIGLLVLCGFVILIVSPTGAAFALAGGVFVTVGFALLDLALGNARHFRIAFYAISNWRKQVRISASYLFRIRFDGRYLLIWGGRFGGQYQPVGGVYKSFPSADGLFADLHVTDDSALTEDETSARDLRLRLPGRHLVAWVRWFESGRNREANAWREFYEELVESGPLSREAFPYVNYEHVERRYHKLRFSDWAGCNELLIADIFELRPNPEQMDALKRLSIEAGGPLLLATEDQIRRRGTQPGATHQAVQISDHSSWVL